LEAGAEVHLVIVGDDVQGMRGVQLRATAGDAAPPSVVAPMPDDKRDLLYTAAHGLIRDRLPPSTLLDDAAVQPSHFVANSN
jgi:hypothetical protein